jgi:hypothetical protein
VLSKQQFLGSAEGKPRASEGAEKQRASEKPVKSAGSEKKKKPDVCEILKEQLALFESDVARKGTVKDRDAFFSKIENVCGDVVVECTRERVAVEKGFWSQFLDKLSKIDTSDDDKIKKQLDPLEFKLFKALKESALIIYSTTEKKWKPAIKPSTKSSTTKQESSASQHNEKRREYEGDSWLQQYAPGPEEA